jgi:hypothetical protein
MYTTKRLSDEKCNMMLFCDKSLCNVLDYWTTFMMHKNAQINLIRACINVTRCWWKSKSNPTFVKAFDYRRIDFGYCGTSTSLKACLHSTTIGTPPWFFHEWHKTLWHSNDQWNKPMPPQKVSIMPCNYL